MGPINPHINLLRESNELSKISKRRVDIMTTENEITRKIEEIVKAFPQNEESDSSIDPELSEKKQFAIKKIVDLSTKWGDLKLSATSTRRNAFLEAVETMKTAAEDLYRTEEMEALKSPKGLTERIFLTPPSDKTTHEPNQDATTEKIYSAQFSRACDLYKENRLSRKKTSKYYKILKILYFAPLVVVPVGLFALSMTLMFPPVIIFIITALSFAFVGGYTLFGYDETKSRIKAMENQQSHDDVHKKYDATTLTESLFYDPDVVYQRDQAKGKELINCFLIYLRSVIGSDCKKYINIETKYENRYEECLNNELRRLQTDKPEDRKMVRELIEQDLQAASYRPNTKEGELSTKYKNVILFIKFHNEVKDYLYKDINTIKGGEFNKRELGLKKFIQENSTWAAINYRHPRVIS